MITENIKYIEKCQELVAKISELRAAESTLFLKEMYVRKVKKADDDYEKAHEERQIALDEVALLNRELNEIRIEKAELLQNIKF